ncbi:hypothetical protein FF38_07591 [Lucilia cuprina]|uniref:Uncharacterized protein n=1 Tax=Lucilia cuprina TaxID=7375 RepID=A0A0L0C1Y2_LUCCU|nr:hypothetical protein FF38_07591 [Lucilia cuprina]
MILTMRNNKTKRKPKKTEEKRDEKNVPSKKTTEKGSGHGQILIVCYLKMQKIPLMKPIMSPRLHPATSPSSSWNPLPSHFSLRLRNLGQWHKICPNVSSSSSSSYNLQKSCVLPSSPSSILVAFGFNFGHSTLETIQSTVPGLKLAYSNDKWGFTEPTLLSSSNSDPCQANSSAISLPCTSQSPGIQHSLNLDKRATSKCEIYRMFYVIMPYGRAAYGRVYPVLVLV